MPPHKPAILYHASHNLDVEQFEPRQDSVRDEAEGAKVFATPNKAIAAMFLAPVESGKVEIGAFDGQAVIIIQDTIDNFLAHDEGGAIYALPSDSFTTDPTLGMHENEWTSDEPVTPLGKEMYETSLDAMSDLGVRIYFVNDSMFQKIITSDDHGWEILSKLEPYSAE